tara:strand:- start:129 stop:1037 length:909 start_codon:yes stop_codon:yes gene_type:complete
MSSLKQRIAAKREKIADKSAGFVKPYKFQNGKTYFRLLPGKVDPMEFEEIIGIHWIKGPDGKVITTVGDRGICYGEPCPVREAISQYMEISRNNGDDDAVKRAKDMLAKARHFANIVVVKAPGEFQKDKAVLAEFAETAWDSLLSQLEEHIEDLADDVDLTKEGPFAFEDGLVFMIERSGSGLDTSYTVGISPKKAPLKPAIMEDAMDLASYKRAQFTDGVKKAMSALAAMSGIDPAEIAKRLAAPEQKAITSATTSKPADEDFDDLDMEEEEEKGTAAEETAVLEEDDILADLDGLDDDDF